MLSYSNITIGSRDRERDSCLLICINGPVYVVWKEIHDTNISGNGQKFFFF